MTLSDITPLTAIAAIGLAVLAMVLLVMQSSKVKRLQRAQRVILGTRGEADIVEHVGSLEEKVTNLRSAVEDLTLASRDHEVRIDRCLSRVGMVRFDAYHDLGGRQSTSVAFLDAMENGMVVTTVVSREFARMYVKSLKDGQPDVPLAPEETEAVEQARAQAPFTIRPRPDLARKDGPDTAAEEPPPTPDESEAARRALDRENRRRRRQGLPPLDELPPAPSTLGWAAFEPAAALNGPPDDTRAQNGDPFETEKEIESTP
ncbi:MAG: DUF4446 family protein [Thermoleophilia bacterium]|nr:DUF4446 family protein [Thermoleophilia bacterium]